MRELPCALRLISGLLFLQILLLYVDSILRTGIVSDNLTSARSNSELVRSLESLLESSLACPKHPSAPLPPSPPAGADASIANSSSRGSAAVDPTISFTRLRSEEEECEAVPSYSFRQASSKTASPAVVTVPAQDAIRQEPAVAFPETRQALDVTAKFFYLPPAAAPRADSMEPGPDEAAAIFDPSWIHESLRELKRATGLEEIDTFIISFPGLVFDERPIASASASTPASTSTSAPAPAAPVELPAWARGCDDPHARPSGSLLPHSLSESALQSAISRVWAAASGNTHLKSLGVSEFSKDRLQWLVRQSGRDATTGVTSTQFRRPRVGQINTRSGCDVPRDLIEFAKEEDVELWVHSDCSGGCCFTGQSYSPYLLMRRVFYRLSPAKNIHKTVGAVRSSPPAATPCAFAVGHRHG
jgi:hypothetical protein